MATVTFKTTSNRIDAQLNAMISRLRDPRPFLNTVIVNMYTEAQLQRWQTENTSETGQWKELNRDYAKRKKLQYSSFPGSGNALMIATGKLVNAAAKKGAGYRKIVTTKGLTISIDDSIIPYAKYVVLERPFMNFGGDTITKMRDAIRDFMMKG